MVVELRTEIGACYSFARPELQRLHPLLRFQRPPPFSRPLTHPISLSLNIFVFVGHVACNSQVEMIPDDFEKSPQSVVSYLPLSHIAAQVVSFQFGLNTNCDDDDNLQIIDIYAPLAITAYHKQHCTVWFADPDALKVGSGDLEGWKCVRQRGFRGDKWECGKQHIVGLWPSLRRSQPRLTLSLQQNSMLLFVGFAAEDAACRAPDDLVRSAARVGEGALWGVKRWAQWRGVVF